MAKVIFTPSLRRHVDCPDCEASGQTVHEVLSSVFQKYPTLKSYVVDEQGALRHHVAVFIDGVVVADREKLQDLVSASAEVHVMQSLSGG